MRYRRYEMPVEPFQEILVRAVIDRTHEGVDPDDLLFHQTHGLQTPLEQITERLARKLGVSYETVARRVYSIRYGKVSMIKLDLADAIVCCFSHPAVFMTDERLAPIYLSIGAERRKKVELEQGVQTQPLAAAA